MSKIGGDGLINVQMLVVLLLLLLLLPMQPLLPELLPLLTGADWLALQLLVPMLKLKFIFLVLFVQYNRHVCAGSNENV